MSTINKEITVTLDYKDVALIAVAFGEYKRSCGGSLDNDIKLHADRLVQGLGHKIGKLPTEDEKKQKARILAASVEAKDNWFKTQGKGKNALSELEDGGDYSDSALVKYLHDAERDEDFWCQSIIRDLKFFDCETRLKIVERPWLFIPY